MKKSLLLCLIFVISIIKLSGQASENLKQLFLDAEYFFMYEDYEEALYSYNTLYKRGYTDNGNINYRIGQCYLNISGEKQRAIPYLEKAVTKLTPKYSEGSFRESNAPYDAYYFLGNAYRINNQFDKAIAAYTQYKTLIGPKNAVGYNLADKEIAACNYAKQEMASPRYEMIENVGRPVSTGSKDFFPVVSGDQSVIIYNSAQKFYDAIFFSRKINNKWTPVVNITPEVQSDGNQYVSSLSYDGTQLYLRIEDNFEANIMVSNYENGRWSKSKPLNKNINTKYWEGNASVSKDGQTLYFSSNKSGGQGALDLYYSKKGTDGDWGPAVNLGKKINTIYNEDAPFITEDNKRLYFVSQGHKNMGGYDIFYSERDSSGNFSDPVNIGYPINNTDDNDFFVPVDDGKGAYMALYEQNGYGFEDIYKIYLDERYYAESKKVEPKPEIAATEVTEQNVEPPKEIERELPPDVEKALTETPEPAKSKDIVTIQTIFFDFNSSVLTVGSKKELDHLAMVLENYPDASVQLIGNTDALGSDEYNQWLSERRAGNAQKYLISKGIDAKRVLIVGKGEKNFIAINKNANGSDNPDGRKLNRRVDIKFLNTIPNNVQVVPAVVPDELKIK